MAKRLGIPVVLLAQCSRLSTERQNKRPTMSDLRGSGSIEEDADIVALLHREDYYRQDGEPHDHLLEMNLDKFRGGQKGSVVKLQERFDQYRAEDWQGPLPSREPPKMGGKKMGRAS
jgi:replicative DNA helicase